MTRLADLLLVAAAVPALAIQVYLIALAIAALLPRRRRPAAAPPRRRFAIVVPACNEEAILGTTLASLGELDYPAILYDVHVVADNCTDGTARLARRCGARCLERDDPARRGKGFALAWTFERLLERDDHDAYVVIDADTVVAPDLLTALDARLQEGARVIQGYYDVLHPERSAVGSLTYLGFALNRRLRYAGRTRLGWGVNLLGNGMCFARPVIERHGWPATSIVEDIEYGVLLNLAGERVIFAPEVRVWAAIPEEFRGARVQRGRWDIGKLRVRNRYAGRLLRRALARRDPACLDAALELLIPPFSIYAASLVLAFLAALLLATTGPVLSLGIWTLLLLLLAGYVLAGLAAARAGWRVYARLAYAPYFLVWRLGVVLGELYRRTHVSWVKTRR